MGDKDTGRAGHRPKPKPTVQPQRARAGARPGASGPVAAGARRCRPGTVSSLRVSAAAYGRAALPLVLLAGVTVLFVAVVWPVLAILLIIRANHRHARERFDRRPL